MYRISISLLVLGVLASSSFSSSFAQSVAATATVRAGCVTPGPADSLQAVPLAPRVFEPLANGVVVMECESNAATGSWSFETALGGFSGEGYLRWSGPNHFGTPGVDVLSYAFRVDAPGDFVMRLWSQQNHSDSTEENDCWVRLDGGAWEKLFGFQTNAWNPNAVIEGPNDILQATLAGGVHTLEFSGRSNNFKIDRADVIPAAQWWANGNNPESEIARQRPLIGTTFSVQVDDPFGQSGVAPGSSALVLVARSGLANPCGFHAPAFGDVLFTTPILVGPLQQTWQGPGSPNVFNFAVPNDPTLVGRTFTVQGALAAPGQSKLTQALDLVLGDF